MTKPTIPESRRARSRTLREMRGMRGKVFSSQFSVFSRALPRRGFSEN
jgi:hypothetical protein